jgi:hypothetical protein
MSQRARYEHARCLEQAKLMVPDGSDPKKYCACFSEDVARRYVEHAPAVHAAYTVPGFETRSRVQCMASTRTAATSTPVASANPPAAVATAPAAPTPASTPAPMPRGATPAGSSWGAAGSGRDPCRKVKLGDLSSMPQVRPTDAERNPSDPRARELLESARKVPVKAQLAYAGMFAAGSPAASTAVYALILDTSPSTYEACRAAEAIEVIRKGSQAR